MSTIRCAFLRPGPLATALLTLSGFGLSTTAFPIDFGVYDARALGMAGTTVAVGDLNQAHDYNPSLIAFHKGHDDRTADGRHSLAFVASHISDGARTAGQAISNDLEGRLSRAIDLMNDVPTPESATIAIAAAQDLDKAMRNLKGKEVDADGYVGYSVTIPADGEGGAFFIGSRLIGSGAAKIEDDDFALLKDYVEALKFIASVGAEGAPHPDLFNAEGKLYSPTSHILSSAAGTGIALTEIGISGAKKWKFWGIPVALGASPKLVQMRAFGDNWEVVGDQFDTGTVEDRSQYFNMDLGATAVFKERFRVGLAVKDVHQRSFVTADGRTVQIKPRARLGLAYLNPRLRLGLDYDLEKNENLHTLTPEQVISLGAEYEPIQRLKFRLGYQHDLAELGNDRTGFGIGWQFHWFETEFSYSSGNTGDGVALQFSIYQ